jgi:Protein of unknown function (DUF1116)
VTPAPGLRALDEVTARAVAVVPAREVTDAVGPRHFLHAGPPLAPAEMPGPMRGAVAGALVFEGEAGSLEEAERLLDAGELTLSCCHEAGGAGAMAGVVSPSMPVLVATGDGGRAFSPLNEGLGRALRFGASGPDVLARLTWMRDVAGPILNAALEGVDGVDVTSLQAEGLRRGDECHNRNVASTAGLIALLAPSIARAAPAPEDAAAVLEYMAGNPHFFLTFSLVAGKVVADAAHRAGAPGLVTAISSNGVRVGIRVSGLEGWITAPAPVGRAKLFDGFDMDDACPMMGDSFITETIGLGAFALSASPAISSFIGTTPEQAGDVVEEMRSICMGTSSRFLIPAEGFRGTPLGIDVVQAAKAELAPLVNNGLAHREPGVGQVGAGMSRLPLALFAEAAARLAA